MIKNKFSPIPLIFLLIACAVFNSHAQKKGKLDLDKMSDAATVASFPMLVELLSMPNDAHFPEDIAINVDWAESALQRRGFTSQRLPTATVPVLVAERKVKRATKTVLFYMHLDGQPVEPSQWQQDDPWIPTLKAKTTDGWQAIDRNKMADGFDADWRIFARSASDDKGPFAMLLAAMDGLAEAGVSPNFNIKIILDFEEEMGSPNLASVVEQNKEVLAADMMLIFDGPRHLSNKPTLVFGARGISTITLTSYGPRTAQHSGHYGNYAPNPALNLAQLLASMKDRDGRVVIPGYYDGITLTAEEKEILKRVPDDEGEIQKSIGIATVDKIGENYQESIQYPSLNIRGMQSGYVGSKVRTIVPADAIAEIDVRLVPESDPDRLMSLIKTHIRQEGYFLVDGDPTEDQRMNHAKIIKFESKVSYGAFRTPFDSEPGKWLQRAMLRAYGEQPVMKRISGGSIPISPFVNILDLPAVTVPTVNPDNNQHGPNENLRIGNYRDGIKSIMAILSEKL